MSLPCPRLHFFLVMLLLALAGSCHQQGLAMSDRENNMVNMPGFVYERSLNGKQTWLTFFRSWGGYEHPVALKGALSYAETQQLGAYYRAYFQGEEGAEQLIRVDKILLVREPYVEMIGQALRGNGLVLHLALEAGSGYELGRALALDDTIDLPHYFEFDLLPDSAPADVRLVSNEIDYSYHYEYDRRGVLTKAVIISGAKVKTIDYENGR